MKEGSNRLPEQTKRPAATEELPLPPVAEWIVINPSYPGVMAIGPITKQTAQRVYHPSKWGADRDQFTDLQNIVARGSQADCERLAERLKSSEALRREEVKAATARHAARFEKLKAAFAAAREHSSPRQVEEIGIMAQTPQAEFPPQTHLQSRLRTEQGDARCAS